MIESPLPQPKVMTSNTMNIDPDLLRNGLSSAMSTEALLAHDLVPEDLPASSSGLRSSRYITLKG